MSTKGICDIVFCLDASDSMAPCFRGVRSHIQNFVDGMNSNLQLQIDWRIDFLAHSADETPEGRLFRHESLNYRDHLIMPALYDPKTNGQFFTKKLPDFTNALSLVDVRGDESPLIALDTCLDFPWREASGCHRIVVMMTDEPFETGANKDFQLTMLPALIDKIQSLRAMLFIVAPDSEVFHELATVDKAEYDVTDSSGDGLSTVDFAEVLQQIGKSVSTCDWQQSSPDSVKAGLYGQATWGLGGAMRQSDSS